MDTDSRLAFEGVDCARLVGNMCMDTLGPLADQASEEDNLDSVTLRRYGYQSEHGGGKAQNDQCYADASDSRLHKQPPSSNFERIGNLA